MWQFSQETKRGIEENFINREWKEFFFFTILKIEKRKRIILKSQRKGNFCLKILKIETRKRKYSSPARERKL